MARVSTLAESLTLLFQSNWGETDMRDVVKRAIELYSTLTSRVELDGPDGVHVSPKSALALGMILHGLVTNAQKYGSLSGANGKVEVVWKKLRNGYGRDRVNLWWRENGGPPVSVPQDTGFGTTLITRGVQYELQAESEIRYDRDGLQYQVIFRLD